MEMTKQSDRTIQTLHAGELEVDYFESGNGNPIIVFPAEDHLLADQVLEKIRESHRIIVLKLSTRDFSTPNEMVEKLRSTLTHLAIERCSSVGISTGASAAIAFAVSAPELVDKLILLSPLPTDSAELPDLTRVKAATLVLVGTADTPAAIDMGRLCREKISSCHLSFIYGARHALMARRACLDPILQFLEEGEQFIIFRESQAVRR
jgi:hypothetical protein